jgi:DNA primase
MSETEEIKNRLPIEEVVSGYVPLKKMGRIFKANCPFHNEKTPSFTVSPDRGIYKCFGCGEGGDIFDFVMKIEGLTFPETIKLLAERAGVQLTEPEHSPGAYVPTGPTIGKDKILSLNHYTAKLWHAILTQHPKAQTARDYVTGRGLLQETIVQFQVGYAPAGPVTTASLKKAGFTQTELAAAGEPGRFQDRITFPISDITGRIVGFTGRLLEEQGKDSGENKGPKYWNTPETALFNKSKTLYALHLAKRAIQEEDLAILVEGQMDVLMLHQAGFANAVASSGTALTSDQIKILGRFSTNIAFAYDIDKAGIQATKRGVELVLAAGLNPSIVSIPQGKDPADAIKSSPELWETAYADRQPFMHWLIDEALGENTVLTPTRKKELGEELLPWVTKVTSPIERQEWLRWLASRLQTDEKTLQVALDKMGASLPKGTTEVTQARSVPPHAGKDPVEVATALLLSFPTLHLQVQSQFSHLLSDSSSPFLTLTLPLVTQPGDVQLKESVKASLTSDQQKEVSLKVQEILQNYQEIEMDEVQAYQEIMLILARVRSDAKEHIKARLATEIRDAQERGDSQKLKELFSQLKNLI